jgi:diketogulonate reductase-like aldo/keto reductase
MSANQTTLTLNNNITMPQLGLGVYDVFGLAAERAVMHALDIGYRLIDTAMIYQNERDVGNAIRHSGIPRNEIFVTTKVWQTDQGYESTFRAFDTSNKKLNVDYIDLYLIHWPIKPTRKETWRALEKLYVDKRVRAIGVSNYLLPFLKELESYYNIIPAVNQIEFSPWLFLQPELKWCQEKNCVLQSYSPLVRGKKFTDPVVVRLATKHNKTPAQIILRWNIQLGVSTIPKSGNPKRIEENFNIFDFQLSEEDMKALSNLNENFRVVEDPMELL